MQLGLQSRVVQIESDVATLKERVNRLDNRVEQGFDKVDRRFDKLDQRFVSLDGKINDLDRRMTVMESRFFAVGESQARLHVDMCDLRRPLDAKFIWMVTTMIAFGSVLVAALAKGFHWIR